MSKPVPDRSYERADSDDQDGAVALADDDLSDVELPLSAEELANLDPLDEKNQTHETLEQMSWWRAFARRWRRRRHDDDEKGSARRAKDAPGPASRLRHCLLFPLPSWSHRFLGVQPKGEIHRPTDYLDGLRGVASLFVFFNHYLSGGMGDIAAYGFGEGSHRNLLMLPFIRTLFSGGAMVAIFFVISGYVLSARCIVAMRAGNQEEVYAALTSMAFRRAIRLFVPTVVVSGLSLCAVFIGIKRSPFPENWTFHQELWHYQEFLRDYLFRVWSWDDPLRLLHTPYWHGWYGGQLWTIPLEFNCSMILFILISATTRCKVQIRLLLEASLVLLLFYVNRWNLATFVAGMTTAELNIIAEARKHNVSIQWVSWIALVAGWYLTGFPLGDHEHTPGYAFLSSAWRIDHLDIWRFWLAISGILVVSSLSFLPIAQRAFTTSIARYLGKISYALYLVHGLCNDLIRRKFWIGFEVEFDQKDNALTWNWVFATIVYFCFVLWMADIFWRLVDVPAVKFAKWVEKRCFVQKDVERW